MLCAYQCYAPLPPVRAIVGQGGDLTNLNINCPNIRDIPYNQIPLQKVGGYWGFDTRSVTVQYAETIAVFKMSSEVIKCPTIGAASFGQSPYIARHLPVRGVVGHNIDRRITRSNLDFGSSSSSARVYYCSLSYARDLFQVLPTPFVVIWVQPMLQHGAAISGVT